MERQIEQLKQIISESNNIAFFGGAGVSTESGIPDFRSIDGLYNQKYKYTPEYTLSVDCFNREPADFWKFYRDKILLDNVKPNNAHKVLVELEKRGKLLGVVTQNIDNLHEMAGSKNVYHIHGTIMTNHCEKCNKEYSLRYVKELSEIPKCECGGAIRPDIVLYGDILPAKAWDNSIQIMQKADVLIIAGTSLSVHPANTMVEYFFGKHLIIINREKVRMREKENMFIEGNIGEVLTQIL